MNEKHMQYVLTVLKEGSFTNAAKKLYVSQPSLSQIIKTAESNLGAPIFDRSTDPINPDAGRTALRGGGEAGDNDLHKLEKTGRGAEQGRIRDHLPRDLGPARHGAVTGIIPAF